MSRIHLLSLLALLTSLGFAQGQDLWIDFNSLTQDGGPHPHPDYQAYDAGHEVPEDFVTREYAAFSTTVSFTPSWPDSTDNRTMQMIDRGTQSGVDEDGFPIVAGNDGNWLEGDEDLLKETGSLDLVTDWIGVDTRTGNGGNGDYDGQTGAPTRMLFTMTGVPAGEYNWTSYHHDTENIHTVFQFEYSVDGGTTFQAAGDGEYKMTNTSAGSNPPEPETYDGLAFDSFDPIPLTDLPSTVQFDFNATGQDVVLQFTPLSATAVHTQIMGVNGFELKQLSVSATCVIPDGGLAGDLNGDGSVAFPDFLILSQNFGGEGLSYAEGDINCDGTVAFADFLILSGNFGQSAGDVSAVPEPASFTFVTLGGILLLCGCRRRQDRR